MLALLQRGHQPLSTSPEPHGSRASLGALLLPGTVAGQDMSSVPVLACAAPHTHLHFPFHGQGVKGTLLTKKSAVCCVGEGIPWALLPPCPVLSMAWLSRENMGYTVYIFLDFRAEAPKLGQWPENSSFLPASHEAVASLYPSWQSEGPWRGDGEQNCPKISKISLRCWQVASCSPIPCRFLFFPPTATETL